MVKSLIIRFLILFIGGMFVGSSEGFASYIVPPGTTLLDRSSRTYMDVSEVTVLGWLEYLNWIKETKGENSDEFKAALPDSVICEKLYGAVRYFQHPKYRHYPIVGISYVQAMNYCKWRTDRVNEKFKAGKVMYLLPDVYDFQAAFKKQKQSKNISSSILPINPKKKTLSGIGYNVQEYTSNPNVILIGTEGDTLLFDDATGASYLLGFRCKAIIIKE